VPSTAVSHSSFKKDTSVFDWQVCEPLTRKRVLSPFQGDTIFQGSRRHNVFCPSLEGKGDQPNGWWIGPVCTRGLVVPSTAVSHSSFKKDTSVFDWQVCEPLTRKRVLSPFQGDTIFQGSRRYNVFCPSLEGKRDRAYARWMGFYTDHTNCTGGFPSSCFPGLYSV
jgi:hypothetical protein